jgi:hypothetical protein
MSVVYRGWLLLALPLALPSEARAQGAGDVAVTPYLGLHIAMGDLIRRPGSLENEKVDVSFTVGGRAEIGLTKRFAVEGDISTTSGNLVISSLGAVSGTDVKVLNASGRLVFRLKPRSDPLWVTLLAGVGATRHRFNRNTVGQPSEIEPRTAVGAVFGATLGFNLGRRAALTFGAEDWVYSAKFVVAGVTSASRSQNDLRIMAGVRIPLLGW